MRNIFSITFYLFIMILLQNQDLYAQKKEMPDLVVSALNRSTDTTDINDIKKILGKDFKKYRPFFSYIPSINPLNPKKLKRFSSQFGRRFHPIDGKYKQHLGLDISAKMGTPIHAAADGIVINVVTSNLGAGNNVKIKHQFGFTTRYCHMYTYIVKKNFKVKKGDIIGFVGTSGKSTGPHLHFEIKKNGKLVDPYPFCFLNI